MTDTAVLSPPDVASAEAKQTAAAEATAAAALLATRLAADGADRQAILANERFRQLARQAAERILDANPAAQYGVRELAADREPEIIDRVETAVVEAVFSRTERMAEEEAVEARDVQERWADNAGNTLSTQLVASSSLDVAPLVEEHLGTKLHKLWMSRGDNKVRGSHRKLHGSAKPLDKPFWKELGTGRELGFPGDPRAPIEQTINCRCWLWYVTAEESAEAEKTFQMPESEFELIAASGHAHGSMWDLDDEVVEADYDVSVGLIAATQRKTSQRRKYEEEKHERDVTGKFSQKPKGSLESEKSSTYDRNVARGRELREKYRGHEREGRRVGGKGGGSEKDAAKEAERKAKEAARDALEVEQESERESQRLIREKMRNERFTNAEKLRARRRMEDAAKQGRRLTEDEAMQEIREEIQETERQAREKQREADQAMKDVERSRAYIRQMRIRGEKPEIIEAERERLLGLESNHKKLVGEVNKLYEKSKNLGTTDQVRRLRDRVRFSRRAEDDKIRGTREQYDASIRLRQQEQDTNQREREAALRARHKAQRRALRSDGSEEYPVEE